MKVYYSLKVLINEIKRYLFRTQYLKRVKVIQFY